MSAYAAAFIAVSGGLAASKDDYPLFTSVPMILAYIFGVGGCCCLVAAVRGTPFPLTKKPRVAWGPSQSPVRTQRGAETGSVAENTHDPPWNEAKWVVFNIVLVVSLVAYIGFAFYAKYWLDLPMLGVLLFIPLLVVVVWFLWTALR